MPVILFGLLSLLALVVLPELWVRSVLLRHSAPRPAFPGTGGEFARHLLDGMTLGHVKVEETVQGDHYHPLAKAVRLQAEHFYGKSLTAIVIAAHEVGHAMQDATGYRPLKTRTQLAPFVNYIGTVASLLLLAMSALAGVMRHPAIATVGLIAMILANVSNVIFHAVTLPVEFDASFKRALPVLQHGGYLDTKDLGAAKHILGAAAYTYVAAALWSLLNPMRWIRR